eukprot:1378814-Rhodomonas_salina.2
MFKHKVSPLLIGCQTLCCAMPELTWVRPHLTGRRLCHPVHAGVPPFMLIVIPFMMSTLAFFSAASPPTLPLTFLLTVVPLMLSHAHTDAAYADNDAIDADNDSIFADNDAIGADTDAIYGGRTSTRRSVA